LFIQKCSERAGIAGLFLLLLVACNALGLRRPVIYLIGGGLVWVAMLGSGVHATVAGVLVENFDIKPTGEAAADVEAIKRRASRRDMFLLMS